MHQKINILLVEDNKSDQKIISKLLDDAGFRYNMLKADTLNEGIEFLISFSIDIILLDLGLPDSAGYKTLQKIIDQNNHIPVIVLTGTQNSIVESLSIKAGAQDYLTKDKLKTGILIKTMQNAILRNNNMKRLIESNEELQLRTRSQTEALSLTDTGYWSMDLVSYKMEWSKEVFQIFNFQNESLLPSLSLYMDYVHSDEKEMINRWFNNLSNALDKQTIQHRLVIGTAILQIKLTARISYEDKNKPLKIIGTIQHCKAENNQAKILNSSTIFEQKQVELFLKDFLFNLKTPLNSIQQIKYFLEQLKQDGRQKDMINQMQTSIDEITNTFHEIGGMIELSKEIHQVNSATTDIKSIINYIEKSLELKDFFSNSSKVVDVNLQVEYFPDFFFLFIKALKQLIKSPILFGEQHMSISELHKGKTINILFTFDFMQLTNIEVNKIKEELVKKSKLSFMDLIGSDSKSTSQIVYIIKQIVNAQNGTFNFDTATNSLNLNLTFKSLPNNTKNYHQATINHLPISILIVDDHFINRLSTKKNLKNHFKDANIVEAENGEIAVNLAEIYPI